MKTLTSLMLTASSLLATIYNVKPDGSGNYTTIQACANAASAGDTCLVAAGAYAEHVITKAAGSDDSNRVTFKANGAVTMQGFKVQHSYVTIDGLEMKDRTAGAIIELYDGADYVNIVNSIVGPNTTALVKGIQWITSGTVSANHTYVHGNTFKRLAFTHLEVHGDNHIISNNTFLDTPATGDIMDVWGHGSLFKRNVFTGGTGQTGGHADWLQIFGSNDGSMGHVFEENIIYGIPGIQIGQLNSGNPTAAPEYYTGFGGITWRRNIFVDVYSNMNLGLEGSTLENNTFFRAPNGLASSGVALSCTLTRGMAKSAAIKNNVFLATGAKPSENPGQSGFYTFAGCAITREVIQYWITGVTAYRNPGVEEDIRQTLITSGYTDGNGTLTDIAKTLGSQYNGGDPDGALAAFVYGADPSWKSKTLQAIARTADMEAQIRATAAVEHNYAGGLDGSGYPVKKTSGCAAYCGATPRSQCLEQFNFCEDGVNGGDPQLADLSNILGPDGIPFTLDDGLKPLPGSPLCGKGEGGVDIGAYSCDPAKVFATGNVMVVPSAPTGLTATAWELR